MFKKVKKCGSGAHIMIPKEHLGKVVEVRVTGEKTFLSKEEIINLIETKIELAKEGY